MSSLRRTCRPPFLPTRTLKSMKPCQKAGFFFWPTRTPKPQSSHDESDGGSDRAADQAATIAPRPPSPQKRKDNPHWEVWAWGFISFVSCFLNHYSPHAHPGENMSKPTYEECQDCEEKHWNPVSCRCNNCGKHLPIEWVMRKWGIAWGGKRD